MNVFYYEEFCNSFSLPLSLYSFTNCCTLLIETLYVFAACLVVISLFSTCFTIHFIFAFVSFTILFGKTAGEIISVLYIKENRKKSFIYLNMLSFFILSPPLEHSNRVLHLGHTFGSFLSLVIHSCLHLSHPHLSIMILSTAINRN